MKLKNAIKLFVIILFFIFSTLVGVFIGLNIQILKNFVDKLHLNRNTTPITELYFNNHTHLPNIVDPRKQNQFQFTIHNLENKDIYYQYEVFIAAPGENDRVIDTNKVFVKKNASKTIDEEFSTDLIATRSAIIVYLINQKQQIDFFVQLPPVITVPKKVIIKNGL